jgi:hypothetical protein
MTSIPVLHLPPPYFSGDEIPFPEAIMAAKADRLKPVA